MPSRSADQSHQTSASASILGCSLWKEPLLCGEDTQAARWEVHGVRNQGPPSMAREVPSWTHPSSSSEALGGQWLPEKPGVASLAASKFLALRYS